MTYNFDSYFSTLAELHADAAARLRLHKEGAIVTEDHEQDITAICTEERNLRSRIIAWQPNSNEEAQTKLIYMVEFLIRTRSTFTEEELSKTLQSIEHLL